LNALNDVIKGTIILIGLYIALIIGLAYVGYFVGMAVSLAASGLFSVGGGILAEIFAWIGVGLANIAFVATIIHAQIINKRQTIELSDEEIDKILEEIIGKESDK